MSAADAVIQLRSLVGDQPVAMVTTTSPGGGLHARPLTLAEIDDHGTLWFLVDAEADWVRGLGANETVNVSFSDDNESRWVSVAGAATVTGDRATIDRLWTPAAKSFLPGRPVVATAAAPPCRRRVCAVLGRRHGPYQAPPDDGAGGRARNAG